MIRLLRTFPISSGTRGNPPISIDALEKTLLNLSRFAVDFRHVIAEVDINPLIVLEKGVAATDILLIRKETTH